MEYLSSFPDKFFWLGHDDPPYFSGPEKRGFYGRKISPINVQRIYDVTTEWKIPGPDYFDLICKKCVHFIIWGANYFEMFGMIPFKTPRRAELSKFIEEHPVGWIIWDKCNGSSTFNDYELAYTSFNRPTVVYKYMWNGMMQGKSMLNGHIVEGNKKLNVKRIHPTQKPVPLYDWVYYNYLPGTDPLNVFDGHVGSGSNRISCHKFGLDFYGSEKTEKHFLNQEARFAEYLKTEQLSSLQNKLF